jgi:hypothetical protein
MQPKDCFAPGGQVESVRGALKPSCREEDYAPKFDRRVFSRLPRPSVPKGPKNSARGFNPGNMAAGRPALKGRKTFVIDGLFG